MRFGICGNLASSRSDRTGIEIIEKLKAIGYDYIELPLSEIMDLPEEDREALAERVNASGIKSEIINNFFPRRMKLTGWNVDKEGIRSYYMQALPFAQRLGAEYVVFGSPFAKSYPLGFDKKEALEQLTELTADVDEFAASIGLRILIEPIHSFESNLINSFEEGVALAQKINAKATDVLLDFYHMTRDHGTLDAVYEFGPQYLRHIHFACPFYPGEGERVFPLDEDEWEPYGGLIKCLKEINYAGRVSIEARTTNFDEQAPRSLAVLKKLFA